MLMKKKNAVAIMIILFICVAVYLNWNYTQNITKGGEISASDVLSDELLASMPKSDESQEEEKSPDSEADSSDYFTSARLDRQKARDNALSVLRDTINENNLSQEARDKAALNMERLANSAVSEARIETLIKAKGFADCVALINDTNVNIIVQTPDGGLTASDTTKIKDIVVSETSLKANQIKIVEID